MDSIVDIDDRIRKAKDKRKQLILAAMDGRTQKFIATKTGIDEPRLSKWINGFGLLEDNELDKLKQTLGVDFK